MLTSSFTVLQLSPTGNYSIVTVRVLDDERLATGFTPANVTIANIIPLTSTAKTVIPYWHKSPKWLVPYQASDNIALANLTLYYICEKYGTICECKYYGYCRLFKYNSFI
jgi:hypothetical protein